jgi:hypothetical protein
MKNIFAALIFISTALTSTYAFANEPCRSKIEEQIDLHSAWVTKKTLDFDSARYQIYSLRTNLHGGEAQTEVVVRKEDCKVVDHSLVWAE